MYNNITPFGSFDNGTDYRNKLRSEGYKDLGWQNGWNDKQELLWKQQKALGGEVEHNQWNRSGSYCTYVIHDSKVFCSVDMGD